MDLTKQGRRTILICVLLSAVTLAIFWPVTEHEFISCDDPAYLTLNGIVRQGLTWEGLQWAFANLHGATMYWHPLTWLSHMLDCQLFGLRPGWHHLVSALLHTVNVVLLFLLLQKVTSGAWRVEGEEARSPKSEVQSPQSTVHGPQSTVHSLQSAAAATWASFFVAAVFALHPLQVDSVAWASERKTLLSAFFFLLTLWAYVKYAEVRRARGEGRLRQASDEGYTSDVEPVLRSGATAESGHPTSNIQDPASRIQNPATGTRWYVLSLILFACGLMSKPTLVPLPFLLLLLDYWPLGRLTDHGPWTTGSGARPARKSQILNCILLEKLPFLALSAVSCMVTIRAHDAMGGLTNLANLPLPFRLANAAVAYASYLQKAFWPSGLSIFYPLRTSLVAEEVALAAAVLVGVSAWIIWSARGRPHLAVGWFWFLGMLVPMIGLVQAGAQEMADRYMYLPLIGLSVALIWELADRLSPWKHARQALIGIGSAVLLACGVVTSVQLGYWRNTECLFQHALEVTGDNYMAHNNLAADCYLQGNFDGTIEHYQASLAIAPTQPNEPQIRFYLGDALTKRGRYEEAAQQFTDVLAVRPNDVTTMVQLGIARARQGKSEEARQAFLEALRMAPNDSAALDNFGNLLAQQGRYAEAVQQFEVSLKVKPDNAAAHNNIAISLAKLNRLGEAINHYREATRLQPDFLPPLNNLAWILAASPHAEFRNGAEAVRLATSGCEMTKYQNPMLLTTLAAAYGEVGQFPEAISFAERAQGLVQGDGGPLTGRLSAMLESFRANRAYHAD